MEKQILPEKGPSFSIHSRGIFSYKIMWDTILLTLLEKPRYVLSMTSMQGYISINVVVTIFKCWWLWLINLIVNHEGNSVKFINVHISCCTCIKYMWLFYIYVTKNTHWFICFKYCYAHISYHNGKWMFHHCVSV